MTWLFLNWGVVGSPALARLWIALPAIALPMLTFVPIARWAALSHHDGQTLFTPPALYAVLSLLLLIIIPVITGVVLRSPVNTITVLTLYGVTVLVRQVAKGLRTIPRATLRAVDACDYLPFRHFVEVELPPATPVIVTGIRVVTTSTASLMTAGVFIGARLLGTLFTDGFQHEFIAKVVIGLVATVLLAPVVGALIQGVDWAFIPRARRGRV